MGSTTPPLIVTSDANGEFEFSADIGIEEGSYRTTVTYAGNDTYGARVFRCFSDSL